MIDIVPIATPDTPEGRRLIDKFLLDLAGIHTVRGGAEIFPDEGLDHLLGKVPLASTAIQTTYHLGLFTAQTDTTVPPRTTVLNGAGVADNGGAVDEPATSGAPAGYARVAIANSDWGSPATQGSGRRVTSAQKSFPVSTGAWGTVNGFFIASASGYGAGVALCYANFDDGEAIEVNAAGFTVRVTPFIQYDG